MTTSKLPPEASGDEPIQSAPKGRTRRSLVGLGGVIAGVVIGTALSGTRANARIICFLRGTMIRTSDGERSVETLAIGDKVVTVSGGARPVKWIGRMSFVRGTSRAEWVRDVMPVRIAKGAIDGVLPRRDLFVSKAHALYIDGVLVPASDLVGAAAITIEAPATADRLDYFHIELDSQTPSTPRGCRRRPIERTATASVSTISSSTSAATGGQRAIRSRSLRWLAMAAHETGPARIFAVRCRPGSTTARLSTESATG